MSKEPLPMQKIETVLRLHHQQGLSIRQIAHSVGLKRSTVSDYLKRATIAGWVWPLPPEWNESDLHRTLLGLPVLGVDVHCPIGPTSTANCAKRA